MIDPLKIRMDNCLLCLEELVVPLQTPRMCKCNVFLHEECMKQIEKNGLSCPICRKKCQLEEAEEEEEEEVEEGEEEVEEEGEEEGEEGKVGWVYNLGFQYINSSILTILCMILLFFVSLFLIGMIIVTFALIIVPFQIVILLHSLRHLLKH